MTEHRKIEPSPAPRQLVRFLAARVAPLALAIGALLYLWRAFAIPLDPWAAAEPVGPRTLPIVYGFALLAIAGLLAVQRPASSPSSATSTAGAGRRWWQLAGHCVAIAVFGIAIGWLGLWLALALLLAALLAIAGERRPAVLALAPLGTPAGTWLLVAVVLDVYIDPGPLWHWAFGSA